MISLQRQETPNIKETKGRTQCRELPLCAESKEGCQWQALPSHVQYEETATRTQNLPVTGPAQMKSRKPEQPA